MRSTDSFGLSGWQGICNMARRPERTTARSAHLAAVSEQVSEADLENTVIECARASGWRLHHTWVARSSKG
ncbi:MAG: hypothetical protein M1115_06975, partial [Actinobacteria bacterium]|nr:hypothetical protein [Actinomycetota bacterium]